MNFFIYLINEGLTKLLPFVTLLIVAKYLSVESFGVLSLYFITQEILTLIINNNIRATTRIDFFRYSKFQYVSSKVNHILGSALLFIIVLIIFGTFGAFEFKYIFVMSLTAFFRGIVFYALSDLQCNENATKYGKINLISVLISNLGFIIAIMLGGEIESWFYTTLLGTIVQLVFVLKYLVHNKLLECQSVIKFNDVYKEFKHGLIFMPQAIGFWVGGAVDRIFISNILTVSMLGYYMFIFQLALPIVMFSGVVNLYLTPKLNKLLSIGSVNSISLLLNKFAVLTFSFSVLNYILIVFIIKVFYIEKYEASLEYAPYIIGAVFLQSLYLIFMNVFYYIDRKKTVSIFVLILGGAKVLISYTTINSFGIEGLLLSNILLNAFVLFAVLYYLKVSLKNWKC